MKHATLVIAVATAMSLGALALGFGAGWAFLHGILEMGQWSGLYDWEPTWPVSLFLTFVSGFVRSLFTRSTS